MNPRILLVGQLARSSCLGLRGERSSFFDVGPRVDWPCLWRRGGTLIIIMRSYQEADLRGFPSYPTLSALRYLDLQIVQRSE